MHLTFNICYCALPSSGGIVKLQFQSAQIKRLKSHETGNIYLY